MRILALTVFLAFTAVPAFAGPSVDDDLVEQLGDEVFAQARPIEAQIEQLAAALETKETAADREHDNARALKLEVKAAKAQVKADQAALKAARKRGDDAATSAARSAKEASEAALEALEERLAISEALEELLKAQADQIEAQHDLREAELQVVYAIGVQSTQDPEFDDSKYRKARAKAEIKFQKARADVSQAETRYTRAGGEVVPDPMLTSSNAAPAMGGAPIE